MVNVAPITGDSREGDRVAVCKPAICSAIDGTYRWVVLNLVYRRGSFRRRVVLSSPEISGTLHQQPRSLSPALVAPRLQRTSLEVSFANLDKPFGYIADKAKIRRLGMQLISRSKFHIFDHERMSLKSWDVWRKYPAKDFKVLDVLCNYAFKFFNNFIFSNILSRLVVIFTSHSINILKDKKRK